VLTDSQHLFPSTKLLGFATRRYRGFRRDGAKAGRASALDVGVTRCDYGQMQKLGSQGRKLLISYCRDQEFDSIA
jgi:hypothetical protein